MGTETVSLNMTGMDDVKAYFQEHGRDVAKRGQIIEALESGGQMIIDSAKGKIHSVSGDLAESLQMSETVGMNSATVTVHHGQGGAHDHLVEYGHGPGGWNKTKYVLPHPYLYPAFEEQKKAAFEKIRAGVAEAIQKP